MARPDASGARPFRGSPSAGCSAGSAPASRDAGIRGSIEDVAGEVRLRRPIKRDTDPLARVHRVTSTEAALESADSRPGQPDECAESGLGQPSPLAAHRHLPAETGKLFPVPPCCLDRELDTPELDHDRCMVASCAWPPITRALARDQPEQRGQPRRATHGLSERASRKPGHAPPSSRLEVDFRAGRPCSGHDRREARGGAIAEPAAGTGARRRPRSRRSAANDPIRGLRRPRRVACSPRRGPSGPAPRREPPHRLARHKRRSSA
jgi:hypothetical protein